MALFAGKKPDKKSDMTSAVNPPLEDRGIKVTGPKEGDPTPEQVAKDAQQVDQAYDPRA